MKQTFYMFTCLAFLASGPGLAPLPMERHSVSADFVIMRTGNGSVETSTAKVRDASNVVVWLTPLDRAAEPPGEPPPGRYQPPRLVQRNKTFEPHVLVEPVGTLVVFPNEDPFFHNIFSLYDGRRFDLGPLRIGYVTLGSFRSARSELSFLQHSRRNERGGHCARHPLFRGLEPFRPCGRSGRAAGFLSIKRMVRASNAGRA
jgi:hypothetical protein